MLILAAYTVSVASIILHFTYCFRCFCTILAACVSGSIPSQMKSIYEITKPWKESTKMTFIGQNQVESSWKKCIKRTLFTIRKCGTETYRLFVGGFKLHCTSCLLINHHISQPAIIVSDHTRPAKNPSLVRKNTESRIYNPFKLKICKKQPQKRFNGQQKTAKTNIITNLWGSKCPNGLGASFTSDEPLLPDTGVLATSDSLI